MKRTVVFAVTLLCLLLCACAKEGPSPSASEAAQTPAAEAEIFTSSHQREEGCMAVFKTHAINTPCFTLHMEDGIFEEAALRQAAEKLSADAEKAAELAGRAPSAQNVYIVEKRLSGTLPYFGRSAFITADELASGEYREAFLAAGYGLETMWQSRGLAGCLFGEAPDESALARYYSDPANVFTASCSPLFTSVLSDDETAAVVSKTAASLASYVISTEGFDAFVNAKDTAAYLPGWFSRIGAEGGALPEGSERAANITLKPDTYYLCVISAENYTVNVTKDGWTTDPAQIYQFICRLLTGCDQLKARLLEALPSMAGTIETRMSEDITINFIDPMVSMTCASPTQNLIMLGVPGGVYHELIHLILETAYGVTEDRWVSEALAEYFSNDVMDANYPTDYICRGLDGLHAFYSAFGEAAEGDIAFQDSMFALYNELRTYEGGDRDDTRAFELAHGIASLLLDGIERGQIRTKYDRTVAVGYGEKAGDKSVDGDALSYPQSLAVLEYLAKEYGLEKLAADHVAGLTVEHTCGKPYAELYSEALNYYKETFGRLTVR